MGRTRLRALGSLATFVLLCAAGSAPAKAPAGEKRMLGFEADEIRRIAAAMGVVPGREPRYFMKFKEVDGGPIEGRRESCQPVAYGLISNRLVPLPRCLRLLVELVQPPSVPRRAC